MDHRRKADIHATCSTGKSGLNADIAGLYVSAKESPAASGADHHDRDDQRFDVGLVKR